MAGSDPPGPSLGPCQPWLSADDVAGCCSLTLEADVLARVAEEASMVLFEVSGRRFPGLCERTVRPCRALDGCGAFGLSSGLYGPWAWTLGAWGGWGWADDSGSSCGCGPLSRVRLAGYPVREITNAVIDGAVVDPATYRIDRWRELVRLSDPGPPVTPLYWPSCQDLSLPSTEPGTFEITYLWGQAPPQIGLDAACQLACQIAAACRPQAAGQENVLPQGVTSVTRQGVKVDRGLLANWFDPTKPTGLTAVDLFLKSYHRTRAGRGPAVISPDIPQYARPVGT